MHSSHRRHRHRVERVGARTSGRFQSASAWKVWGLMPCTHGGMHACARAQHRDRAKQRLVRAGRTRAPAWRAAAGRARTAPGRAGTRPARRGRRQRRPRAAGAPGRPRPPPRRAPARATAAALRPRAAALTAGPRAAAARHALMAGPRAAAARHAFHRLCAMQHFTSLHTKTRVRWGTSLQPATRESGLWVHCVAVCCSGANCSIGKEWSGTKLAMASSCASD